MDLRGRSPVKGKKRRFHQGPRVTTLNQRPDICSQSYLSCSISTLAKRAGSIYALSESCLWFRCPEVFATPREMPGSLALPGPGALALGDPVRRCCCDSARVDIDNRDRV